MMYSSAISLFLHWKIISTKLCCLRSCRSRTLAAAVAPNTRTWLIKILPRQMHLGPLILLKTWNFTHNRLEEFGKILNDLRSKRIKIPDLKIYGKLLSHSPLLWPTIPIHIKWNLHDLSLCFTATVSRFQSENHTFFCFCLPSKRIQHFVMESLNYFKC